MFQVSILSDPMVVSGERPVLDSEPLDLGL